jgi:predicted dehydrogenase
MTGRRIGLVGVGTIAAAHLDALERIPGIEVLAGADVNPGATLSYCGSSLPVYPTMRELLLGHDLDDLIVATPAATHVAVCEEAMAFGAKAPRILVEKPLATTRSDVERLLAEAEAYRGGFVALYHFRYAPEVIWAWRRMPELLRTHGAVDRITCSFFDPYISIDPERRRGYLSSWIDTGINALSVVDRLVDLRDTRSLEHLTEGLETWLAVIEFDSSGRPGVGTILTSWQAVDSSKSSVVRFTDGAQLILDHTACTAWLADEKRAVEFYGMEEGLSRKTAHYLNMFTDVFSEEYVPLPLSMSSRLHRFLFTVRD